MSIIFLFLFKEMIYLDFKGIEFYDGNEWNDNVKVLKKLCKKDSIN